MKLILFLILFSCSILSSTAQKKSNITVSLADPVEPKEGLKGFYKYIAKNLKYPKSARQQGIEGKVYLRFMVEKDGSLADIEVIRGIHPHCDAEAIKVLKEYPNKWINRKKEDVAVSIAIIFKKNLKYKK